VNPLGRDIQCPESAS